MLITNKSLLKNQECFFRKFNTNLGLRVTELQIGVESFQVQVQETVFGRRAAKKEKRGGGGWV